jgi:hypothetical protein
MIHRWIPASLGSHRQHTVYLRRRRIPYSVQNVPELVDASLNPGPDPTENEEFDGFTDERTLALAWGREFMNFMLDAHGVSGDQTLENRDTVSGDNAHDDHEGEGEPDKDHANPKDSRNEEESGDYSTE